MAMQKRREAKASSSNLVLVSAAFQDHIIRNLLHPDSPLSDPFWRPTRLTCRNKQARQKVKSQQRLDVQQEQEYVVELAPPALTLAQKLGLVASPGERLTEDKWAQVKTRSELRNESAQPCAICKEDFLLLPQVLLSCSHIFHRACLHSFEKFSGKKCCPVCRTEQYETRVIHDAANLYRQLCATRIQAFWRGYVARKRYSHMRKTECPKNKVLRRRFFEERLQELNDSFVRYCHTDMEAFLSDIDRSLSSSRRVFQQLERKSVSEPQENDWNRLKSQVDQRGVFDCSICLTAMCDFNLQTESPSSNCKRVRHTILLSCSHLFHQLCLEAFEAFSDDGTPKCPLCRSPYHKKVL